MAKKTSTRKRRKSSQKREQANQFDKIMKENSEFTTERIIEIVTGLTFKSSKDVPAELQRTIERRPDFLKQVIESDDTDAFWHVEYQVLDDKRMLSRCFFYCGLCKNKAMHIPVRQFVIYLGEEQPTMETRLIERDLTYCFHLIALINIPYPYFLATGRPEEAILAILGNFQGETAEKVIMDILNVIIQNTVSDLDKQKYFQQLQVIGQLRNFGSLIENIMFTESLRDYVSIEKTPWYKYGVNAGTAAAEAKFEKKLVKEKAIWERLIEAKEREIQEKERAKVAKEREIQEKLAAHERETQEKWAAHEREKALLLQQQEREKAALVQMQEQLLALEREKVSLQLKQQEEKTALQIRQQQQQMIAALLLDKHFSKEKIVFILNISLEEIDAIEAKILKIKPLLAFKLLTVEEMARTFEVTNHFIQLVIDMS